MNKFESSQPSLEILNAFGLEGTPLPLEGGEGKSFLLGNTALKPVYNQAEHNWAGELLNSLEPSGYRISRPVKTLNGTYAASGWSASTYEAGKHIRGRWKDKLAVSRLFHNDIKDIPVPAFLNKHRNLWAMADSIAWEESPLPGNILPEIKDKIEALFAFYKPVNVGNQVIHSDLCGNILFSPDDDPLVIDFSSMYRPVEYAEGILTADAIAWEGAPVSILDLIKENYACPQMILRAVNFRVITAALFLPNRPEAFFNEYKAFKPLLEFLSVKGL